MGTPLTRPRPQSLRVLRVTLSQRIENVRESMAAACTRAGRKPDSARLVVVTKAAPPEIFAELGSLEVTDLGENRVQGSEQRLAGVEKSFRWHFVGHLQSNKVRKAVPLFDVFHGVDTEDLMWRIDRVAGELHRKPDLMLQVNISGEASKSGLTPHEVRRVLEASDDLKHARLTGLMTMAPQAEHPEACRPVFQELANLRDSLARGRDNFRDLSMGMSSDFAVAIEEGATWVRIGRQITAPGIRGVD
jgi:PLP dependent protein